MQYLLLFHGNYGYANAPQCYVYTYIACLVVTKILNCLCTSWYTHYQIIHVMRRLQISCRLYNNVPVRQVACERLSFMCGLLSPLIEVSVLSVCVCVSILHVCLSVCLSQCPHFNV
jgi:hypothetical protein